MNIRIGISACLLGQKVRYDGGHKLDRFLTETLGQFVEYVPVCPETECGMGVPREPLRLVGDAENPRLLTVKTNQDFTRQMHSWGIEKLRRLESENLCGFIFKSRSPSSGMQRVKVYDPKTLIPSHNGTGIFARMFMAHFPMLPVEDDGRMHDPTLRENFIERVFVFKRWRELPADGNRTGPLVDFHTRHKLLFLSHSPKHYRQMGKLVAMNNIEMNVSEKFSTYQTLMMETLALKATVKKHVNVLQHIMGYFKKQLSAEEKQELLEIIDQYHKEYIPLIVPVTLINHYVKKYRQPYLSGQIYLTPHPIELKLRNHV